MITELSNLILRKHHHFKNNKLYAIDKLIPKKKVSLSFEVIFLPSSFKNSLFLEKIQNYSFVPYAVKLIF